MALRVRERSAPRARTSAPRLVPLTEADSTCAEKAKTGDDSSLVAELANDERSRDRKDEVGACKQAQREGVSTERGEESEKKCSPKYIL